MYLLDVSIRYWKYFCVLFVLFVFLFMLLASLRCYSLHLWWFYFPYSLLGDWLASQFPKSLPSRNKLSLPTNLSLKRPPPPFQNLYEHIDLIIIYFYKSGGNRENWRETRRTTPSKIICLLNFTQSIFFRYIVKNNNDSNLHQKHWKHWTSTTWIWLT